MGAFASFGVLLDTASSVEQFVRVFVGIYILLILIWVLLSWVRIPYSRTFATVEKFLSEVVTPYLGIFRGRLPTLGPIDISPIIAVVVLLIAQELVIYVIGAVL
jgi:YggT family protein